MVQGYRTTFPYLDDTDYLLDDDDDDDGVDDIDKSRPIHLY